MHSVNITIVGEFWDSQIYSGELLLFGENGSIHRIDWHQAIDGIATLNSSIQTALRVAFSDSDLFYNPKVRKILHDPLLESPIKAQLSTLASLDMSASWNDWRHFWKTEDTPFDFLPTDTDIYYNQIYAGGDEGLFSAPRGSLGGRVCEKSVKHHDARVFQVKASDHFTTVATAAGDDGLFEFAYSNAENKLAEGKKIASRPCSACDWAFQSVMGWTADNSFLASFREIRDTSNRKSTRVFDRIIEGGEIFSQSSISQEGFTWGCREKVYRLSSWGLEVKDYEPANSKKGKLKTSVSDASFEYKGHLPFNYDISQVVSTGTAPFGTVIELNDKVVVIRSDGALEEFPGEPMHWRIFPRSEHYSNQLHLIYEGRILIVSFVHDYFVKQSEKLSGFARGA